MTTIGTSEWPKEALELQRCSLKVKDFKCFRDQLFGPQGCDVIKPINIIIGKNNSGKTAFLESIQFAFEREKQTTSRAAYHGQVVLRRELTGESISSLQNVRHYQETIQIGSQLQQFSPANHGNRFVGKSLQYVLSETGIEFDDPAPSDDPFQLRKMRILGDSLKSCEIGAIKDWRVLSVKSDRDVSPESKQGSTESIIDSNGTGLTRIFQSLMLRSENNREDLIENVVVPALNEILGPDNKYERILVRENDGIWEIYLDEKSKGQVPLSSTGSGIKTILLVLAKLLVLPEILGADARHRFIFMFEELENNLHPSTLRKLFRYIARYSNQFKCHFFITTHSHIVIDMFSCDDNAQILHVVHDGISSKIRTIGTRGDGSNVLNDLDVRASELLQTNVVVWVEGPTDAMYFERWVDLHSNNTLRHGIDYQCVCYGGSVGSHITFDSETADKLVEATKICRHSIYIADSNRNDNASRIEKEMQRIRNEVMDAGGYGWITEGREIENYLPLSLLMEVGVPKSGEFNKYSDIYEVIRIAKKNKQQMRKVNLANRIVPKLTTENMYLYDLKEHLIEICERIKTWNGK